MTESEVMDHDLQARVKLPFFKLAEIAAADCGLVGKIVPATASARCAVVLTEAFLS
jgi:hypothetical protein